MKTKILNQIFIPFLVFILVFSIYFLSNPQLKDHYKHQVYLAYSLTQKHWDLIDYPDYYHDIFEFKNKKYTAFSPLPIFLLLPLVVFFHQNTNQVLIAIVLGTLNAVLVFLILKKLKIELKKNILLTLFFAFGTLNWYASVIGTSWFFSHIVAVFFLLLSLLSFFQQKSFLTGLFWGMAVACRYPIFASLPAMIFLVFLTKDKKFKKFLNFILGIMPGIFLCLFYNYIRFGTLWESGYSYANLAYSSQPSFSFFYLPRNLFIFLFKSYDFIPQFPFLKPDPQGLSIFFTSPFLIYSLTADKNKKITLFLWLAVILIATINFSYFLTGWFQFGYRFLLDFLPFLIILTALGLENQSLNFQKIFLLTTSIIFNLLGVYWGLKLGW